MQDLNFLSVKNVIWEKVKNNKNTWVSSEM